MPSGKPGQPRPTRRGMRHKMRPRMPRVRVPKPLPPQHLPTGCGQVDTRKLCEDWWDRMRDQGAGGAA